MNLTRVFSVFSRRQRGFTLVEVLTAMTIITVVASGAFAIANYGSSKSSQYEEMFVAQNIADQKIAEYKADPSSLTSSAVGGATVTPEAEQDIASSSGLTNGRCLVYVQDVEGDTSLKGVMVVVSWDDRLGVSHSRKAMAILYAGDL